MSLAIIDAREWQNHFVLETGQKRQADDPITRMVSQVLAHHPYPGDMEDSANAWVSETALDLMDRYTPNLVCLSYVQQFFANRHFAHTTDEQDQMFSTAMAEANRFIQTSGYTPLGQEADIRDINTLIRSNLDHHKIALVVMEGVGQRFFPDDRFLCRNGPDWSCHEPGDAFYLTLSTGKHEPFAYPAGYRYFDQDDETIKFPFSGYMTGIPEQTLALDYPGRSIAVGNRSMFMHMVFGVDISIECFARNLFNQGCMGVIHNRKNGHKGDMR